MFETAKQAVGPPHDENVELAVACCGQKSVEFWPPGLGAADPFVDVRVYETPPAPLDELGGFVGLKRWALI
ncbi:MAG: hypothetical protein QM704_00405 [Anaeromyxobacteraceae bacterium]